ncbi:phosphonate ABC transporter substrate-binding protein [Leptolyngbya sp. FACHB-541]|nr:phosphonate ABC transporter substrate-binding protein [Leptolyngbya sp. FACHB-541]
MLRQLSTKFTSVLAVAFMSATLLGSCINSQVSQRTSISNIDSNTGDETCAPEIEEIEFGISPSESQENLKTHWAPFLAAMEAELGRPVIAFYATDYAGVIEAMGANKLQLAWYGGKAYIEAAKRSNAEAFTRTVNSNGTQGYYSHLITNVANPIVNEVDLQEGTGDRYIVDHAAELTFAFNDPNSTSGFLVPTYYIFARNRMNPNEAFKELIFAGSHEATALAVVNNQVDVATNNSETLTMLEKSDPETRAKIQVIWTSPVIPTEPIAYRKDLPSCLKEQISSFFYNYKDVTVLEPLGWSGFVPAEDKDWNTIRELEIAKDILEVQNNQALSTEEKQQQINQLEQQLEELQS